MRTMRKLTLKLAVLIAGLAIAGPALAKSSYMTTFRTAYPAAVGSRIDSCTVCHTVTPTRNSYGTAFANANHSYTAIASADSDGDGYTNAAEITALTFPGSATDFPAAGDTTAPVVSAFTLPATATSLTVTITTLTATDAVGVTGYLVTETSTAPTAAAAGWATTRPASYTFATEGAKTLYAWAKDAAGNVSTSRSASVTITLPDTVAPTVTAFTLPASASSLTVTITTLTATDAVGVTGFLVTETSTAPTASAAGWVTTRPASYTFASSGAKTLYAWAKDAAGNVSTSRSASVTITLSDTTAPAVSAFTLPATSSSLTVTITTLTATDAVGVTGFLVTETATAPSASATGWTATRPASYTFASSGAKTLYAWAKDAAGNVSTSRSASVTITLSDTTAPAVSAFTLPATSNSLTVTITTLTATDAVGVTGFLVTETATTPSASAAGWATTRPASYTFASSGAKTLYAWAKDAAGNVSTSRSASVTITLPDTVAPTVTAFTLPSTSTSLTVTITTLTATDAVGVTGFLVTETSTTPSASAAGWATTRPASYTFATEGAKTLYAFAKDAAGNVSTSRSASVTITLEQTFCPATWLTLSPSTVSLDSAGQEYTVSWTASSGCEAAEWTAASTDAWITILTATSGTGAGSLTYSVAANAGAARTGYLTIGTPDMPRTHTVEQASPTGPPSYVLWTRSDTGQAALWQVNAGSATDTIPVRGSAYLRSSVGVGGPWQATSYSPVSTTEGYVLWTRADTGQAALWRVNPGTGAVLSSAYLHSTTGVGAGWQATSYSHVSDTEGYVLWTRNNTGQAALWRINPDFATSTISIVSAAYVYTTAGVGAPWQATGYSHVSDTEGYVLWTRSDTGQAALWKIDPSSGGDAIPITDSAYLLSVSGVGAPWQATEYTHVSATEGYVLWTRADTGQAALWKIDPSSGGSTIAVESASYLHSKSGVGGPWKATGYAQPAAAAAADAALAE